MSLKQPNSGVVYQDVKGSGAATSIDEMHFVDDGAGHWVLEAIAVGTPAGMRLLDDGSGHYATHAGADNPSNVGEQRFVDVGSQIMAYE